jgi:dihydrolipoamide dehydrogenase
MSKQFDVVVIGGGPGGYIAAIRAAQLGFNVACIDEWKNDKGGPAPGGTCTNVGCIPSKALLQSSEHYDHAAHAFADHGIGLKDLSIDVKKMIGRKDAVVKQNNDGILYLLKKNKVTFFHGRGSFVKAAAEAAGRSPSMAETLVGKQVIVATGSTCPRAARRAVRRGSRPQQRRRAAHRRGAQEAGPDRLGRHRAGDGLGVAPPRRRGHGARSHAHLPGCGRRADRQGSAEGLHQAGPEDRVRREGGRHQGRQEGRQRGLDRRQGRGAEARGRQAHRVDRPRAQHHRPQRRRRGPDARRARRDRGGRRLPHQPEANVWAVGDVVRGPMLAHKAEEEGVAVAERIAGQHGHVNFNTIPWVIYTSPEIAWVGETEQALKAARPAYKAGTFPFLANGRARALGDTTGMVKFLADAKTDEILGVHIVGPMASELIAEAVVAMEFKASSEDIARICHAHPSLSEATKEAALAVDKRTLNF